MTPNDHRNVDDLFAYAFEDNPYIRALFRDADTLRPLRLLNRTVVRGRHTNGIIAEVDGRPAGAMLFSDSPQCEPDGLDGYRFTLDAFRALRWRVVRAARIMRALGKNHPDWPHRHLSILGVLPDQQGSGIGSALLERFCADVDAEGKHAYLETDTDSAKSLYERFGFREVNRTEVNGVSFIYMWRMARQSTS